MSDSTRQTQTAPLIEAACPLSTETASVPVQTKALVSEEETTKAPATARPCCVCKEEKAYRDECMLLSKWGEEDCKPLIDAYRVCMAGYGFKLP